MYDKLTAWLRLSAERIHDEAPALTALDRAIGDGDHGINMDRGFAAIVATLDETEAPVAEALNEAEATATLLRTAGKRLISTVGGAAGPLYGTAFLRAAGAIAAGNGRPAETIVAALEAAAGGVAGLGKAAPGEKTMLDALVPAAQAARAAVDSGADLAAVAAAARDAAEAGAVATIPMLATKGRASYLGERSVGHQDPGATSSALLLRALADVASD
jgi:phosphoenolpyruvate---glycerone phosphotransferase subunit DhaL